jgi:hypothetical protein
MAKPKHKEKALINATKDAHSTFTLVDVGFDLTGWTVKGDQITDNHNGVWTAKRTGNQKDELRLLLKCDTVPKARPDGGDLTITLTKGGVDKPVGSPTDPPQADYTHDPEP